MAKPEKILDETTELPSEAPQEQNEEPKTIDVVEVEWENLQHIFEFRQKLVNMENYFANMCLQFEKNKTNMMTQITYGENDLYSMAVELQKTMNVSSEISYELKLPTEPGEKGYFLRKDNEA
tara:strand:- start:3528 stop:3893 length:366 start_codon:yes stop_codon:yes gene_type:complete